MNSEEAVQEYQCPGCIGGDYEQCFEKDQDSDSCKNHIAGTKVFPLGRIFLGMPKGFNRLGISDKMLIKLFESYKSLVENDYGFDYLNVPVWKYLDENGNTLVRGFRPRINEPFLMVILGNCIDKIDCFEVYNEIMKGFD